MKIKHLLIGLFAVAATVACDQELVETPSLEVSQESLELAAKAGEASFDVTANLAWTATADQDWVNLEPASGDASKNAVTVTVTAENNTANEARTATVTVTAGELTKTVALTQAAAEAAEPEPVLTLAVNEASVAADATSYEVALTANCAWEAEATDGVTVNPATGEGDATVTLTFAANEVTSPVTHSVTFSAGEGLTAVLTLTQAAAEAAEPEPVLTLAVNEASVAADATSYEVALTANCAWEAVATDGVTVTPANGEGDAAVTLTFAANEVTSPVTHTVTFSAGEDVTAVLTLTQAAAEPVLTLAANEASVAADATSYEVALTANCAWTAIASEGVTVDPANGEGDAAVTLAFAANEVTSPVTHTVTFSAGEDVTAVLTLTQAAAEPKEPQAISVADFLKLSKGTTEYQLTGVMEGTYNTTFGNFYLNDGTDKVLVYGLTATKVASNDRSFASLGLRDGDTVTLIGIRDDYNGTPQVAGPAYYVSHVAAPYVDFATPAATVEAEVTTYTIEVLSNAAWTATPSEGVTLDKTFGEGAASVVMTFAANATSEVVNHSVVFAVEGSTATFELNQKAVPVAGAVVLLEEDFTSLTAWETSNVASVNVNNLTYSTAGGSMYKQKGCLKFGKSDAAANTGVKLPKLTSLTEATNVTLTFKAVSSDDSYTMVVSATAGATVGTLAPSKITKYTGGALNSGAQTATNMANAFAQSTSEFSVTIENVTADTEISIKASGNAKRWYLDDVKIVQN